jgi:superfamily I DNA/RNA helicase/mRNA-degrading endonuclease RelE of RelBE toxin-antitoxin system
MQLSREINMKPSFLRELHNLPSSMDAQVWEKINFLAQNPIPDGKLKKKLQKYPDVYRLRIGDFRLFYTFGSNWIRLLSIRARKEAYRKDVGYEEPLAKFNVDDQEIHDDEEIAMGAPRHYNGWSYESHDHSPRLPVEITPEWLNQLRIPEELHPALVACQTEDDLLSANVPNEYIERVVDNIYPRPVTEILDQPDFVLFDTDDLIRYKEGDLKSFLLRLDSEQERLVDWALHGPAMIKGGPGTGKSTIALYRVRSLLDHADQTGNSGLKVLFTTYTETLTRFSRQLLEQLLGERMERVVVETADNLAISIASLQQEIGPIAGRDVLRSILLEAMESISDEHRTLLSKFRPDYLLDEIEWVIDGRDITSFEEYQNTDRSGRGIAFNNQTRTAMWCLYVEFDNALKRKNVWSISGIRRLALNLVRSGVYREKYGSVIIDEAQDLTPASLSLLVELAREQGGLYLTADASQSIYFRGFSWKDVHDRLRFRGRTVNLRRNYRTTREIATAASDFLRRSDCGDPDSLLPVSSQSGPQPILKGFDTKEEQWKYLASYVKQMSRHLRLKPSAAAVLVPDQKSGEEAASALTILGLPSIFTSGTELDLDSDEVKVLTIKAAKGLEFPIVAITDLADNLLPGLAEETDEDEIHEELKAARRTLYVGMTRAMRGLMLLYPNKNASRFIKELGEDNWYRA